jgi:aspartate kinase
MSLVVANAYLKDGRKEKIIEEFQESVCPDRIYTHENIALVAVVGCGMVKNIGTSARIFKAIADAEINVNMIDQGSSELNIIIGVENDEKGKCIRALYNEFFN